MFVKELNFHHCAGDFGVLSSFLFVLFYYTYKTIFCQHEYILLLYRIKSPIHNLYRRFYFCKDNKFD